MDPKWKTPRHAWTGLGSERFYSWQEGVRLVAAGIGDMAVHTSMTGFAGYSNVIDWAIRTRPSYFLGIGHSNGNIATSNIAVALEPYKIPCILICFDRTRGYCPPVGKNVIALLDIHARLKYMETTAEFTGEHEVVDASEYTHIGVISVEKLQTRAVDFANKWLRELGVK